MISNGDGIHEGIVKKRHPFPLPITVYGALPTARHLVTRCSYLCALRVRVWTGLFCAGGAGREILAGSECICTDSCENTSMHLSPAMYPYFTLLPLPEALSKL